MDKCRESFEKYWGLPTLERDYEDPEGYSDFNTELSWLAYKAAWNAKPAASQGVVIEETPLMKKLVEGYNKVMPDCQCRRCREAAAEVPIPTIEELETILIKAQQYRESVGSDRRWETDFAVYLQHTLTKGRGGDGVERG